MGSVLDILFSSKTRVKLLVLFLMSPAKTFYQRELERLLEVSIRSIQQEIKKLLSIGFLTATTSGNRIYFQVNKDFILFDDLKKIILKTQAVGNIIQRHIENIDKISFCFIFGSFAQGKEKPQSDIDLMVIGKVSAKKLSGVIHKISEKTSREVNPHLYSESEFLKKYHESNHFIKQVALGKKIYLIGKEYEFTEFIK